MCVTYYHGKSALADVVRSTTTKLRTHTITTINRGSLGKYFYKKRGLAV